MKPPFTIIGFCAAIAVAALWHWRAVDKDGGVPRFLVFDQAGLGCPIWLAADADEAARRAARLVQHGLAKASGLGESAFPIRASDAPVGARRGVWLTAGEEKREPEAGREKGTGASRGKRGDSGTLTGGNRGNGERVPIREEFGVEVGPWGIVISAYPGEGVETAAAWFLEQAVAARWFVPGELGEEIRSRRTLQLQWGRKVWAPSFVSRNLSVGGGRESLDWWRWNRSRIRFQHTHFMSELFPPDVVNLRRELAPVVNGATEIPSLQGSSNWQPNIAHPLAADQAAEVLRKRTGDSAPIGMNDSIRYDQSAATLAKVGVPRWFRGKPDYSNLVFDFVNAVARKVPDKYLGAYAYDWTEDAPRFRVERNVVPYLTADRSEWFDPAFADQDQDLIRRWVASGAEYVGLYDYYYGSPFLVPRPTVYAVTRSIPFAHRTGVRAFYSEVFPNWGLDGPKPWLAAQLLWDATKDPEALLATYYQEFWREAAEPMRAFYELCDEQWLNQPRPSYWIKYYKDEHQHLLFPADVRAELRQRLEEAGQAARETRVRERVEMVRAAFAVSDAFCRWCETRDRLARALAVAAPDPAVVTDLARAYGAGKAELEEIHAGTKKRFPLALQADLIGEYTRNELRRKALLHLAQAAPGAVEGLLPGTSLHDVERALKAKASGREVLFDAAWQFLPIMFSNASTNLDWVRYLGWWWGHGEPYETRKIGFTAAAPARTIRFSGCKQDTLEQTTTAVGGAVYITSVRVRAKVSPGNMTFLIMNFLDETGKPSHLGFVDRVPVGDFSDGIELTTWAVAPAGTRRVGIGLRVLNQVNDDFVEFSEVTLKEGS